MSSQVLPNAVIITGTPGVGKHTIGKLLAAETRWPIMDLNELACKAGLSDARSRGGKKAGMAAGHHIPAAGGGNADGAPPAKHPADPAGAVDVDELACTTGLQLGEMGRCIVIGHLAPYVVPAERAVLAAILRRSPQDLVQVYKERGYSPEKARQNAGAEILGVVAHDAFSAFPKKAVQFDTTRKKPGDTAKRILDAADMQDRRARGALSSRDAGGAATPPNAPSAAAGDTVDWLGDAARDGMLETFFAHTVD